MARRFETPFDEFAERDLAGTRRRRGVFDFAVGASSADIRAQGSLVVQSSGNASAGGGSDTH
jgi:hypothetical protein